MSGELIAALLFAALAAQPAQARCSPPTVLLAEGDKAFIARFWYQTPRRRAVEDEIRAAFKAACKSGLLKGSTIAKLGGISSRRLYLSNAPEANVASMYVKNGRLLLEYPYVAADRSMHVPTAAQIQEAIFCAAHGASAEEQARSGRCLPD